MKRKRSTRFCPIHKIDPVSGMVAGDKRKMMEAWQARMAQEAALNAVLLAGCTEALLLLREMAGARTSNKTD